MRPHNSCNSRLPLGSMFSFLRSIYIILFRALPALKYLKSYTTEEPSAYPSLQQAFWLYYICIRNWPFSIQNTTILYTRAIIAGRHCLCLYTKRRSGFSCSVPFCLGSRIWTSTAVPVIFRPLSSEVSTARRFWQCLATNWRELIGRAGMPPANNLTARLPKEK